MAENKQPELLLKLRFAETDHLLNALESLPEDKKKSVTHADLHRQLTIIKDHWIKMERDRKARQNVVLRRKSPKTTKPS